MAQSSRNRGVLSRLRSFCKSVFTCRVKLRSVKVAPRILESGVSNERASAQNTSDNSQRACDLLDALERSSMETSNTEFSRGEETLPNLESDSKTKLEESIQNEQELISKLRKKTKVIKRLTKIWQQVDTDEQTAQSAAEIQITILEILEKERSVIEEKKACKQIEYNALKSKGYTGVVSETLWQCKSLKLRLQYHSLTKEADKLNTKIQSLVQKQDVQQKPAKPCPSHAQCKEEQNGTATPRLFRDTNEFPAHLLLPKKLYSIAEETDEEMAEYEAGVSYDPRTKSKDYQREYIMPDGQLGWMDFLNLDEIDDED